MQLKEEHLDAQVKDKRLREKTQKQNTSEDIVKSCTIDQLKNQTDSTRRKDIKTSDNTKNIRKGILKHAKTPGSDGTSKYLNPGLGEPSYMSHSLDKTTPNTSPKRGKLLDNPSPESCAEQSESLGKPQKKVFF